MSESMGSGSVRSTVARLLAACPAAAVAIAAPGRLTLVNDAASRLLGAAARPGASLDAVLGLGWRELEIMALDDSADLFVDCPRPGVSSGAAGAPPEPLEPPETLSLRLRLERFGADGASEDGIVAFLEPAAPVPRRPRRPRRLGIDAEASGDPFAALFGSDPQIVAAKQAAARFARTGLPVMLLAETGTGKDLLARAIHAASPRHDAPFVAINCGALSSHLLESELFGYGPGAFTGASRDGREGKIGAAQGGTLFLDEVAEMPGPLQAMLLRVLEDGTYYRVGENQPRRADVRLLCATCRDLPRLVREGGFRQDLFYRLNGARLGLPTVRRRGDVAALVHHLLEHLAATATDWGGPSRAVPPAVDDEAMAWILSYSWPGNVRELKTALLHALILAPDTIRREHLPTAPGVPLHPASVEPSEGSAPAAAAPTARSDRPPTMAELEADALRDALRRAQGNLTRAAESLGIARTTLYRRMEKHGIDRLGRG